MYKKTILLILALPIFTIANAQNISNKQVGFSIGLQGISCEQIPSTTNLDFLNYLESDDFTGNYIYVTFNGNFKIKQHSYANLVIGMYSDLLPVKLNVAFSHIPWNIFGFGFSFLHYPEYINDVPQFHWDNDETIFGTTDSNYWQKKNYSLGFALGPEVKYSGDKLTVDLRIHAGFRWVSKFDTRIAQKEINGNYRRIYDYAVKRNVNPYLLSEFELRYRLLSFNESKRVGLKLRAACELSNRTLNYNRTTYEWTAENRLNEEITLPKHQFNTVEFDLGAYFEW